MPISIAVSIPSRVIISSVKRKTPANAFAPVLQRRLLEMRLDLALHPPRMPPHVDDERCNQHGGDERQHAFPQRLVRRALKQHARTDAQQHRERRCPSAPLGRAGAFRSSAGTRG